MVPHLRILLALATLSLLLSAPSIARLPRVLPFLDPAVRAAAPEALRELRQQGLWLVNVDLLSITHEKDKACFLWEHRYRARARRDDPELLTTCIHARP